MVSLGVRVVLSRSFGVGVVVGCSFSFRRDFGSPAAAAPLLRWRRSTRQRSVRTTDHENDARRTPVITGATLLPLDLPLPSFEFLSSSLVRPGVMATRRLQSYHSHSSCSSVSSSSPGDVASSEECLPSAFPPLFRRASSLESNSHAAAYESPEEDAHADEPTDEADDTQEDDERHRHAQRTPRGGVAAHLRPQTIAEENESHPPRHPAPDASLHMARTQSMPNPPRTPHTPSSTSALPGTQPGLGASISWTPGLAPPAPYVAIVPLARPPAPPTADATTAGSLDTSAVDAPGYGSLSAIAFSRVAVSSSLRAEDDDLARAPPPSRHPSLMRQKGTYVDHTSRAISMPVGARERYHRSLQLEVQQREREHRAHLTNQVVPPMPPTAYPEADDADQSADADSDDLPPM